MRNECSTVPSNKSSDMANPKSLRRIQRPIKKFQNSKYIEPK